MAAPYSGLSGVGRNWRRRVIRVVLVGEQQASGRPECCKCTIGRRDAGPFEADRGAARVRAGRGYHCGRPSSESRCTQRQHRYELCRSKSPQFNRCTKVRQSSSAAWCPRSWRISAGRKPKERVELRLPATPIPSAPSEAEKTARGNDAGEQTAALKPTDKTQRASAGRAGRRCGAGISGRPGSGQASASCAGSPPRQKRPSNEPGLSVGTPTDNLQTVCSGSTCDARPSQSRRPHRERPAVEGSTSKFPVAMGPPAAGSLKAVRFIMRDACEQDQSRVHTGFLKLCNSHFRWAKRRDLIVARMNRQKPEAATRLPIPAACRRWELPR